MQQRLAEREQQRQTTLLLTLAVAIVASLAFSDILTRTALGIATFWPATALLVFGLMVLHRRRGIGLAVMTFCAQVAFGLLVGDTPAKALIYAGLDTGLAYAFWTVTRRAWGGPPRVRTMRQLALLVAMGAPIALAFAILCATFLYFMDGGPFLILLWAWFARSGLGLAIVLPASLILLDAEHRRNFRRPLGERLALYAAIALITATCFYPGGFFAPFMIFPFAMIAAFRLGARGAAESSLIVASVAIPLVTSASNDIIGLRWGTANPIRIVQVFIALLFTMSLATGLALAQQERLKRLLVRREQLTRAARARALAATEAKTEFLATMSHEIRTPLNSVLGFAQLLAARQDLPPDARRQVNLIDSAGGALLTVVNDILDFSRVEAGQVDLLSQPTSAAALLRDTVAIMAPEARAKGLSLNVEVIDPLDATHDLDEVRLRQVLLNLLNNAVKFTDAGRVDARLLVEAGDGEDRLRFEVIDTGVGISAEKLPLLFQRFSQVDSSASRTYGGAGLGLAISRALVELMGGRIGVDSVPGRGSCFWFEIMALPAEPLDVPEPRPVPPPSAARILLVDDHPMNREIGVALLTLAGCQVDIAEDGQQAVEAASQGRYDIILMDIHMPRMDGLAATRAIRNLPSPAAHVPIIAMSADALPQQVERCYAAGMVDHIAKPIQRELLYAKVDRWLNAPPPDSLT
ncbi:MULTISPECIES: hybrid sensor histidine kinase/response regulator [unclassified Caulobacter]|uniref:hybrid sensor histidine kinase/response regulator n=1 Tax=unclassified Caulobacter TaxID=2648921 RepID=UPI000D3A44FD|nr:MULTISPECIES: ATP-binding protein [unclassified Caulobacter]PTS90342.1 histidine kinase [Caulobacter sp. HMWF009]PTT08054.1 histidine kinase [Caulobacter sp. HMWF025]